MENTNQFSSYEEFLAYIVEVLDQVLATGQTPTLPSMLADDEKFGALLDDIKAIHRFSLELANGRLDQELRVDGKLADALKSLQANLRRLTWQTQRVALGDFDQKVEFMSDFSTAFNMLVRHLKQSRDAGDYHTGQLPLQKQSTAQLMLKAQSAHQEVEKANQQLESQLKEIQGLQELLREQAIRDQLTGLFNRRYLNETLERELARAQRSHYPVSLIMINLDDFNHLNDTYGHYVGKLILQSLGKMLLIKTRLGDIPCRYSEEEIVIVFPNVDTQVAAQRAQHLRQSFEELSVNNAGLNIWATISAGVASFPEHATDVENLLHVAQVALYAAREIGQNRVAVYQTPEEI